MALGTLTLSTTQGVQGRPFAAKVNGLTTGQVRAINSDGTPGFSVQNGILRHEGLPDYRPTTVVLREYDPGAATSVRETRIALSVATQDTIATQVGSMIGGGRKLVRSGMTGTTQPDGSIAYSLYATDDLGATAVQAVGTTAPPYTLPTPVLLNPFNSLTNLGAVSNGTSQIGPNGGVQINSNGKGGTAFANKTDTLVTDPATFGTVVYQVDSTKPFYAVSGTGLALGRGGSYNQLIANAQPAAALPDGYGKRFVARHISEYPTTPLNLMSIGSGQVDMQLVSGSTSPFNSSTEFRKAYANAAGRPTIVLTFDDGIAGQRDILLPMLNARGLKATFFPAKSNFGVNNSPTMADWQAAYAQGHDVGFDGSSDDLSLVAGTEWPTVAAALAEMKANSQYLIDNGMPRAARHFCWPFGIYDSVTQTPATRQTRVCTTAATTNLVLTTGNTTNITVGMAVLGLPFAAGTMVAAIVDSTNITLSQAPTVASTLYGVAFVDTTVPFYNSKLLDAIKADGSILTGRAVGGGDVQLYTRWGLGDLKLLYPSYALTNSSVAATVLADVDKAILRGTTLCTFGHNVIPAGSSPTTGNDIDAGVLGTILDGLVSRRAANQLDVLTISQWYARDLANPAAVGS